MINYRTEKTGERHLVYEQHTRQTITSHPTAESAKALAKHLNLGGGFDGRTPNFMVRHGPIAMP